ncbi:Tuberous sclerosis 2-like protein [Coemansia asiatica]|uniref:Tuberous sclerosis 2-like protein n=1 Tax=Coemansia asiatica TaxID=1052880 RepID=A0A9W8CKC6_9FUNG|nr:Tuberous sclerosis 2-like protein [Coemansia asiatica]
MNKSERPVDSERLPHKSKGGSSSGSGSKGGSSLAALFRNVLRSSFQADESRMPKSPVAENLTTVTDALDTSKDNVADHTHKEAAESAQSSSLASHDPPQAHKVIEKPYTTSTHSNASSMERNSITQPEEPSEEPVVEDAELLVLAFAPISDRDATLEERLSALEGMVSAMTSKQLDNIAAIWNAVSDIARILFQYSENEDEMQLLSPDKRAHSRLLILNLLAELASSKACNGSIGSDKNSIDHIHSEMLFVVSQAVEWPEIILAAKAASWVTDNAQLLGMDSQVWFERARAWVEMAVQNCYPEDAPQEPLHGPPAEPQAALTASLEFISQIVCAEYPVLDPDQISELVLSLCTKAAQTRLVQEDSMSEVTWTWTEAEHLYGVLYLLKTVITFGALSKDVLTPGIMLLCTTVNITMCKKLCCDIIYTLFTSCYMRDTLLAMNFILRRGNRLLNAMQIYGMPTMTPYQAAVNGMVYYITQVMDTGPTGLQFSLRIGNCLPVLGKAAECLHPEVLRLVFPYLCKITNDDRVDSMLSEDWEVLISIMTSTIDCRTTDKYADDLSSDGADEDGSPITLSYLYDCALKSVVTVYFRSSSKIPASSLVQLLYQLREVLCDDLAQSLLCLVDKEGLLRSGDSGQVEMLETMMHLFYFDRSRSVVLRQLMIQLCNKVFSQLAAKDLPKIVRMPIIMSLMEQLYVEDDEKIVESVLDIVQVTLKRSQDSDIFSTVLRFAAHAATEPKYIRPTQKVIFQPLQQQQQQQQQHQLQQQQQYYLNSISSTGDISPGQQSSFSIAMQTPTPPVLVGSDAASDREASYPSYHRVSQTIKCLLGVLEWRITNTDVGSGLAYVRSAPDTIELTEKLLDFVESVHTFSSVQRDILSVFLRLHADSTLKLYILNPDSDTVMDQRVSLHENVRLRIFSMSRARSDSSVTDSDNRTVASAASYMQRVPFPIERYINTLLYLFQTNTDIETYYVLCRGLSTQLGNTYLFSACEDQTHALIIYLIAFLRVVTYGQDPRMRLNAVDKTEMNLLTYGLLTGTIHYKDLIRREHKDSLIIAFSEGLIVTSGSTTMTSTPQICLHALTVTMLELPDGMMRKLPGILQQLTKIYSAAMLGVHLLEFVSSVSREHRLYASFLTEDYMTLFAVAINYIRFHNNQRRRETSLPTGGAFAAGPGDPRRLSSGPSDKNNSSSGATATASAAKTSVSDVALSQYVLIMAYQVIDVYYLSLPPATKAEIVDNLIMGLLQSNYSRSGLDEANAVCLDMILQNYNRTSDEIMSLSESYSAEDLGQAIERSWLQHSAIVTIRAQTHGPLAQIIVRSASGTTSRIVNLPAEVCEKHAERAELSLTSPPVSPATDSPNSSIGHSAMRTQTRGRSINRSRRLQSLAMPGPAGMSGEGNTLPADSVKRLLRGELIQSAATARAARLPISFGPAPCLAQEFITAYQGLQNIDPPELLPPHSEAVARSIRVFDSTITVDTHKVSVAYVGPGQTTEREILLNQQGSPAYWNFLRGLGKITRLSGMKGFSANLDTSGQDDDGRYTIRWRDLIAQLVFHVGTLMPAREDKHEQIIRKKAHMGNDYVQIVFNESGREYEFDTIPSQFNYVQIIVTPVDGSIPNRDEDAIWLSSRENDSEETQFVQLYKVKTQVHPEVPFFGPAMEPKLLTLTALPAFVRSIAIHAAILSQVFSSCKKVNSSAAEFISPWRARLRTIQRIRLYAQREKAMPLPVSSSGTAGQGNSAGSLSHAQQTNVRNSHLSDFGTIVDDPTDAITASQALGYLMKDLEFYLHRM